MKKTGNKPSAAFIVILALLILPVIVYISVNLFQLLTFDREQYVISVLEDRYNSEFICIGQNKTEEDSTTIFLLRPSAKPNLTVTASYREGLNKGPEFAVPFNLDYRKEVKDDFFAQIAEETVRNSINVPFTLSDNSSDTESICEVRNKVAEQKKKYVKSDYSHIINDYFSISVTYHGKPGLIELDPETKDRYIKDKILLFIEKAS